MSNGNKRRGMCRPGRGNCLPSEKENVEFYFQRSVLRSVSEAAIMARLSTERCPAVSL